MSTMSIYATGGAAINIIAPQFSKYHSKKDPNFAEIHTYFIDTSRSNLTPEIPEDCIYLIDNVDGSGKYRPSNIGVITESTQDILHKFKPSNVNIVVHSCSGGSGSTLGPTLVSELLARDETVIVVTVGSTSSRIETENTIKTLKSYEIISQKRGLPVINYYRENSVETPRGQVDAELQMAVLMLAVLFSGDNKELDKADLKNFINYQKVTSYKPKLSLLDLFSEQIILGKNQSLVSVASLVDHSTSSETTIPTEYQAVGFLSPSAKELITVKLPIHACVIAGYFNGVIESLETKLKSYDETRKIAVEKSIAQVDDTEHTDTGIVL